MKNLYKVDTKNICPGRFGKHTKKNVIESSCETTKYFYFEKPQLFLSVKIFLVEIYQEFQTLFDYINRIFEWSLISYFSRKKFACHSVVLIITFLFLFNVFKVWKLVITNRQIWYCINLWSNFALRWLVWLMWSWLLRTHFFNLTTLVK